MARLTRDVSPGALAAFDALIDVRSPAEFAEDHLPGAVNLPVLDDAERAEVGTLYVQKSKFEARRLGAAMVARNIAAHLDGALSGRPGGFSPLVYCWRGGQRSAAMVSVMDQVGWPVTRLEGGYQTWRRHVVARLHDPARSPQVILLDGPTGAGKTALLAALSARGVQTLDLESLANHRGSLFGAGAEPQPGQKLFESRLTAALAGCRPERPVVVEAESSRIGRLIIPHGLWSAMKTAPAIAIDVPVAARVRRTVEEYADIARDLPRLQDAIAALPAHHSRETRAAWLAHARAGDVADLAEGLIRDHYDPAYRRSTARSARASLGSVSWDGTDGAMAGAADAVARLVKAQAR